MEGNSEIPARSGRGWRRLMWGGAAILLALPALAMQFTREVTWGPGDFLVFGAMLLAACSACEVAVRLFKNRPSRLLAIAAVGLAFALVWAELAVGIFD
ncbi:hypothetical protein MNQ95_01515 [Pseudoxanthomonas daejeonensis]|nr:hypothetical protein [Pseudoxanthomonas daejeonensis]UNK57821.1 hypothetical protein MNQ95_01515 [Pseudoxanthomonas daejeonensis]